MRSGGIFSIFFGVALLAYAIYVFIHIQVVIEWKTASEMDTVGFNIYRSLTPDGPFEKITAQSISSSADPLVGGSYKYYDKDVIANQLYFYQLMEVEAGGSENSLGIISVFAKRYGIVEGAAGIVLILLGIILLRLSQV